MSKSPLHKNLIDENADEQDDLTRIRGIGPVKQQWLKESLNIYTFRELASQSVDELESKLREQGQSVSRSEIEGWIVQARELAAAELSPEEEVTAPNDLSDEDEPSQPRVASRDEDAQDNLTPPLNESEWSSLASFTVEFQSRKLEGQAEEQRTVVCHQERGTVKTWSAFKNESLQAWMLEQVREDVRQAEADSKTESTATPSPVAIRITQLQAFQPLESDNPILVNQGKGAFSGVIQGGKPFALKIVLGLAGSTATNMTQPSVTCLAQFYAHNRATGAITHLGDTESEPLVEGQLSYTTMLPETSLEQGLYRLQVLATLQGMPATPGFLEVPLLPVV